MYRYGKREQREDERYYADRPESPAPTTQEDSSMATGTEAVSRTGKDREHKGGPTESCMS